MSIFFRLGRLSKESVQAQGFMWSFVTSLFFTVRSLVPRSNPKLEDHPFSAVRDCLFNIYSQLPSKTGCVSFVRSLKRRHAVVTRDPHNMVYWCLRVIKSTVFT
jgi:hypothetical protein